VHDPALAPGMGKWDSDSEDEVPSKKTRLDTDRPEIKEPEEPEEPKEVVPEEDAKLEGAVECDYDALVHGCRSVERYEHLNFIDQGTYGMVFKARCRESGVVYALKQVKVGGAESNKVGFPITALREINILLALRHPNIVRVREMVVGSSSDKVFMVMEYCEMDLKACMQQAKQPFSVSEVKQLMLQLLSAVAFMHSKWYVHRDLKTSNLLYSYPGRLTVCDFGLARTFGSPLAPLTAEVVTLWYRCPELLLGCKVYSTALDVWSVGCIFGEMLLGRPLLPGEGEVDQLARIFSLMGAPNEDRWPGVQSLPNFASVAATVSRAPTRGRLREMFSISASLGSGGAVWLSDVGLGLLAQLLELDPSKRLSSDQALESPWLRTEAPLPARPETMPRFENKKI